MARDLLDKDRFVGTMKDFSGRGWHAGMNTLGDFSKFLLRGNVVDLAVGVVIGAAFNGLVQGFVNDFLQPLVGVVISAVTGKSAQNFNDYKTGVFAWGHFIGLLISFILTAAVLYFFVVKPINALEDRYSRLRPKKDEAPENRECPFCLSTVPLKATRCAYCTAQLPPADTSSSQPATP